MTTTTTTGKPRLAVVSPFLDKSHGTERRVAEWVTQLANTFEIHVYSQQVKDIDLTRIVWHRIPRLPGPHFFNFIWWFLANSLWRFWDRHFRNLPPDLVFSPGVNCLDADAVSVHIVFAEYVAKNEKDISFARHSLTAWPRLLHRRMYYRLVAFLERSIYSRPNLTLILIAGRTSAALKEFYGRDDSCPIVYLGLDHTKFNAEMRLRKRDPARKEIGLADESFAVLLIGNDWRNKGGPVLLDALAAIPDSAIELLVVSRENPAPARAMALDRGLGSRMHFLPPREDVEFYYAAADAYVGPSLEDTFAQPPAEAMACGLPVIVSAANGAAEIITDGVDGLILQNPCDAPALATMIRALRENHAFRSQLAANASRTAQLYTWERNGRELTAIFEKILGRSVRPAAQTLAQGPSL